MYRIIPKAEAMNDPRFALEVLIRDTITSALNDPHHRVHFPSVRKATSQGVQLAVGNLARPDLIVNELRLLGYVAVITDDILSVVWENAPEFDPAWLEWQTRSDNAMHRTKVFVD